MIKVSTIYDNVQYQISKENGYLSFTDFNKLSKRAELRLLDWVTGRIEGNVLPQMYVTQKTKDAVAPLITKYPTSLDKDGFFAKPLDYYHYENMYALVLENIVCDEDEAGGCGENETKNNIVLYPIQLLDGDKFLYRQNTFIKDLKPTEKKAIAKEVGLGFDILPKAIGGVKLEYIRYPKYAVAVGKIDTIYNDEVIDESASTDYEWSEYATEALVYFIVDFFSNHTREQASKQFNQLTNKEVTP